jgi:hypothetical protein
VNQYPQSAHLKENLFFVANLTSMEARKNLLAGGGWVQLKLMLRDEDGVVVVSFI